MSEIVEQTELAEAKANIKEIRISGLINDLKSGLTRYKKDDLGFGSIEEKYSLTFTEVRNIIAHPKLKGIRVAIPSYILIDDTENETEFIPTISVAESVTITQVEEEPIQLAEIKIIQEEKIIVQSFVASKKTAVPFI